MQDAEAKASATCRPLKRALVLYGVVIPGLTPGATDIPRLRRSLSRTWNPER
jgi:hypothetical protein